MKKVLLILIATVFLFGCPILPEPEEDLTGFKDCSEIGETCIMSAVNNCEKAFAEMKDEFEAGTQAEMKFVVYGMQGNNCKVKYKIGDITQKQGEGDLMTGVFTSIIANKEMICMVPEEDIHLITEGKMEELMEKEYCTGSLIDSLKTMKDTFGGTES